MIFFAEWVFGVRASDRALQEPSEHDRPDQSGPGRQGRDRGDGTELDQRERCQ